MAKRPLVVLAVITIAAMSCRAGEPVPARSTVTESPPSSTATAASAHARPIPADLLLPSMPTGTIASSAPLPPPGQRPPCAKDEDCWSSTCCPATAAEHCVHGSLAQKCAIVDVTCAKSEVRYDCVCVASQCAGRLHP